MSFEYKRGHVVNAYFPNNDHRNPGIKDRPCVILKRHSATEFVFICTTGTNWSGMHRGFWIKENTKEFSQMRLTKQSFIDLDDIKILPESVIRNYRGYCPLIDKIEETLIK